MDAESELLHPLRQQTENICDYVVQSERLERCKKMNFRSFSDLARTITNSLHLLPADLDLIVGIPRSGLLVASLIALELNLPLADLYGFSEGSLLGAGTTRKNRHWISSVAESKHALVIDDSVLTGTAIGTAKAVIEAMKTRGKITYAAVYAAKSSLSFVDLYFELCEPPRMFEWNFMHHPHISNWCVDIDGVLCRDPSESENDDGVNYLGFLESTLMRVKPTYEIGWLVSSRLEKYRLETEAWLNKHNIRYRNLVLLDGCTADQRRTGALHGKFKAAVYCKVNAALFIESDLGQAREIARLSGKPVICTDTREVIGPDYHSLPYARQVIYSAPNNVRRSLMLIARSIKRRVIGAERQQR